MLVFMFQYGVVFTRARSIATIDPYILLGVSDVIVHGFNEDTEGVIFGM